MKKIIFFLVGFLVISGALLITSQGVFAADSNFGLDTTAGAAGLKKTGDVATILGNVAGTALSLISVLFFILMIYGGITWMLARGKEDQAKKALDTIIAAIIGIIIVLASYAITNFVFKSVSGVGGSGGSGNTEETTDLLTQGSSCTDSTQCVDGLECVNTPDDALDETVCWPSDDGGEDADGGADDTPTGCCVFKWTQETRCTPHKLDHLDNLTAGQEACSNDPLCTPNFANPPSDWTCLLRTDAADIANCSIITDSVMCDTDPTYGQYCEYQETGCPS